MKSNSGAVGGKPHFLNAFFSSGFMAVLCFAAIPAAIAFCIINRGIAGTAALTAAVMITAIQAGIVIFRNSRSGWEIRGDYLRLFSPEGERKLMLRGITCAQIRGLRFLRISGCVRVKIYCEGMREAWISMVMKKACAEELIERLMNCFVPEDVLPAGSFRQGRHSAAAHALTAERPLMLLLGSLLLTVFSHGSLAEDILASALLIWAVAEMAADAAKGCRLSPEMLPGGYRIRYGLFSDRTVFIPYRSAVGVSVKCSPAAAFCGAWSMELICGGGRRVPCVMWAVGGEQEKNALRLLGISGDNGRFYSDPERLRRKYFREFLFCMSVSVTAAVAAVSYAGDAGGVFLAGAIFSLCVFGARCWLGLRVAGRSGAGISPSALRAGGISRCRAEQTYLRRSGVEGIRISSPIWGRMDDLCSIMPVAGGKGLGLWCRYVPYSAVRGITARFL